MVGPSFSLTEALSCLQGERETNELNNKLAQFSENAMKFTMDGGLSAYDYKAEEDAAEADINFKRLAGATLSTSARQCFLYIPCASYFASSQALDSQLVQAWFATAISISH